VGPNAGLELTRADDAHGTAGTAAHGSRLQFTLRSLLSWITVLAVVLGLFQYAVDYRRLPALAAPIWRESAVVSLGDAALALAAFWAAFGSRRPVLRGVALALTTAAIIGVYNAVVGGVPFCVLAELCVVQILWLVGSLWVFRVAGYRIVWPTHLIAPVKSPRDSPAA
jgi:hypothetical protein